MPKEAGYFAFDQDFRKLGYRILAGVDEVGRGCWAGPVVAAAVILPADFFLSGLRDSKLLSSVKREEVFDLLIKKVRSWGVGIIESEEIDRINIHQATIKAMRKAVEQLQPLPQFVLVDGNFSIPQLAIPQQALVKGDSRSASIAAASVLAKVTRDSLMKKLHQIYPQYNFAQHKGYGTAQHYQNLQNFGPCPLHRRSFAPVKNFFQMV